MKKLVILGNGFDLGSGLPTSYKDYFKYYNSKNSKTLTIIEEFLNMDLTKYISYYPPSVGQSQLKAAKRSEKLSEYTKFISQFDTDKTISIWDLYFWYSGFFLQKSNDNWSDVESQISYLINNISTITFINYDQQSDDIETILYNFTKFISTQCDIFKYICATILMNRYGAICESEYLGIFKRELNLFEENFREYIANISETQIYGSRKNIGIYRDNFFKVTASKKSDFFVLNFNYTDFSSKQKKESVLIIRNKE